MLAFYLLRYNAHISAFQFGNNILNDLKTANRIQMKFDVDSPSTKNHLQHLEDESNKSAVVSPASQLMRQPTIFQESRTESSRIMKWQVEIPEWAMRPPLLRPAVFGESEIEMCSELRKVAVSKRSAVSIDTPDDLASEGDDMAPHRESLQESTAGDRNRKQPSGPFYFATVVNSNESHHNGKSDSKEALISSTDRTGSEQESPVCWDAMPPWLKLESTAQLKKSLASKLNALERSMGVYLTRLETAMVISTISKAFQRPDSQARNDEADVEFLSQKILCIDFLSLLVEYMEMSHITLCAAVWHFRTCFLARKAMLSSTSTLAVGDHSATVSSVGPWSTQGQGKNYVNWIKTLYATHVPLESKGGEDTFSLLSRVISGTDEELQIKTIARQASKLKVTEMMAEKILSSPTGNRNKTNTYSTPYGTVDAIMSLDQASVEHLQSLLLSVNANGDWRALAIRTAACLFRLRGLHQYESIESPEYRQWRRNEARKALYLFAPLAHRMGMRRLKEELEREGFRLLYRRQHDSVMRLYEGGSGSRTYISRDEVFSHADGNQSVSNVGDRKRSSSRDDFTMSQGMKSLLSDVTLRVKRVLQEDHAFMEHIASVSVTARVKEPYSLWKKMVRMRKNIASESKDLSIFDVPDALALRVVLRAGKRFQDEDDEVTKARERALCYYVRQLCEEKLPSRSCSEGTSKYKDYIKRPKSNGYQSLHYRFKMRWRGEDWPFEIQIRSTDMHRVAECGIANHLEYKMQSINSVQRKGNRGKSGDGYLKSVEAWKKGELLGRHHHAVGSDTRNSKVVMERSVPSDKASILDFDKGNLERNAREDRKRAQFERLAPYLEALSAMGTDLAREHVIVFLSMTGEDPLSQSGAIISLPAGARVLDALREGEKKLFTNLQWLDNHAICKNGVVVTMTERLSNGDILTVAMEESNREETYKIDYQLML